MKKRLRKKQKIKELSKHCIIYDSVCFTINDGMPCENVISCGYGNSCMLLGESQIIDKCPTDCPYRKKLLKFSKQEARLIYKNCTEYYTYGGK